MKKIVGIMLSTIVLVNIAFAQITPEQLLEAEETLRQMDSKISVLRGYVQMAFSQKVEGISLTFEQIENLKNAYLNEKEELKILYQGLP